MTELKKKIKRELKGETEAGPDKKKVKAGNFKEKPKFDGKTKKFDGKSKNYDGKSKNYDGKSKNYGDNKFQKPISHEPPKQSWNEIKQQKKELKIKRKINKNKDMYDLDVKCKKIYEELKMKSTKTNKEQLCEELQKLLENADYSKLSHSPDRARIIQMMLKKASLKIKHEIAEKIIPFINDVALSKYGKFCVSRLMTYCGKEVREKAVNGMLSNIVKLTTHNFSNGLIDMIYLNHATPDQKNFMKQELYSDLYKNDKNKAVKTLKDTWTGSEMMRNGILNSTKMNLTKIASKNHVDNSLVHAVLLEYLEAADEKDRNEVITAYIPHIAAIASTKCGSRAATLCYLYSVAKERRAMLKSIKDHIVKLAIHEHGHVFVLEILNATDDTLNIKKTLFTQIVKNIEEIALTEYGKRVIYFIVSPTKEFLHPQILRELTDDLKIGAQKKDIEIRRKELVDGIESELCAAIKENPKFWIQGGHIARVTVAILQNVNPSNENQTASFDAISEVICDPEWMVNETEPITAHEEKKELVDTGKIKKKKKNPIEVKVVEKEVASVKGIEHSGLHIAIKKLAKLTGFANCFIKHFNEEILQEWIKINRACFVINEILEHSEDESKANLKEMLVGVKDELTKLSHAGAKVLIKKL
ncbi:unnamed protein product [Chironomus riparius]|uniref:PUM-HD domain-containing protein n=1 Tax=Chironomus riparius TaxID=315576 RepID=A0A9N9S3K5_9DIPT|nr:unnamed protein product [Chironomus riparius]